jgi:cohesin complex subunit SA-1/2
METTNRRKSGRVHRKPELFAEEHHQGSLSNGSAKRKRADNEELAEDEEAGSGSDVSSSEESDGEPDEEELKEKRRQSRNKTSKPVAKKAKTNGTSTTLAIRSANIESKPGTKAAKVQKARARPSQLQQVGLYAQVFGHGKSGEDVAADWYKSLERNTFDAIQDLVNFILQCIGCDSKIESCDVEDQDYVPSRLGDILEEFKQEQNAEYPLISKLKQYTGFRPVLIEFFGALVQSLHTSSILYENKAVFDNIQTWVATMSGAALRPFRHTATVISLTISTTLCEIAGELQKSLATTRTQIQTEKKKKSVNKGRVKTMEDTIMDVERKIEVIDELLKDSFDTVFVHRYRDVDDKIRVECAKALGTWLELYRKMFLEGQYLRYLGWVLSDPNVQTRLEVIRQLKSLFKDRHNIAALRAFTERFRPRIVEMGARDTDTVVRAEAIELLDRLRNAELLEPDDIDTIGRLIFDAEPRVRRSVSKFFVSNIEDLYKASTEEMDKEQYEAALPTAKDNADSSNPSQSWIKFKCLAQTLTGYDSDGESVEQPERPKDALAGEDVDSRYMLATQSIFPHMKELQEWESLAGYLLYDHSQITAEPDDADVALAVQGCYKLESGEESILLDVLFYAVKLYLQQIVESQSEKKGKKTQASRDAVQEKQEFVAHNLTMIIPQLLNKFGSTPSAAASILRLEQLLNIDIINELSQGEATYSSLLDDINRQFVSHSDRKVLAEASKALRQARTYEQSKEVTDAKVREIWDDSTNTLQNFLKDQNVDTRGTLPIKVLTEVSNTVSRLAYLAGISDCTSQLERKMSSATGRGGKSKGTDLSLFELFLQISRRGVHGEDTTAGFAEVEDELCSSVISTLSLYFRWKVFGIKSAVTSNNTKSLTTGLLVNLVLHRTSFIDALSPIIMTRTSLDPVRILALETVLDIFTLFSTVRHMKPEKGGRLPDDLVANLKSLVTNVPEELQAAMMLTHGWLEKSFARKTRRKLEKASVVRPEVGVDDAPIDSDDELDEEDGDGEDGLGGEEDGSGPVGKDAKKQAALLAEQSLCEFTSKIVLALIGQVVDGGLKAKLVVNRARLGPNYRSILGYLEEKKPKGPKKQVSSKDKAKGVSEKSEPMVLEEDDIEDEDADGNENDEEQGLGDHDIDQLDDEAPEDEGQNVGDEVDEIMGD